MVSHEETNKTTKMTQHNCKNKTANLFSTQKIQEAAFFKKKKRNPKGDFLASLSVCLLKKHRTAEKFESQEKAAIKTSRSRGNLSNKIIFAQIMTRFIVLVYRENFIL